MKEHFDGVAFSYEKEKQEAIEDLAASGSFASTHSTISDLNNFDYFSVAEIKKLVHAAMTNDQVKWILSDFDVRSFFEKNVLPQFAQLSKEHQQFLTEAFLNKVD